MDRTQTPQPRQSQGRMAVLPPESTHHDASGTIGLALIGLAGGLLGAMAMNVYARVARSTGDGREATGATPGFDRDGRGMQPAQAEGRAENDAAIQMGRTAYRAVSGHEPDANTERRLGTAAHYAFGAAAGVMYALLSEQVPALRKGFGSFYGTLVWAIADEGVVPALGLSRGPRELPAEVHAFSLTGHCVYGTTLEGVRQLASYAWRR